MSGSNLTARDRQVCVLVASGLTADEIARKLGIGARTVSRVRALPDAAALIAEKERDGVTPRDVLTALLYSPRDEVRMRAAIELAKLAPNTETPESVTVVYAPPAHD